MNLSYSKINQCWFLIWNTQVVATYESRQEALTDLRYKGLKLDKNGKVSCV